jgi:phosphotriesterase-related protein
VRGLVRTVLGDITPSDLGVTYAHEHLILDSPLVADRFPHILLDDLEAAVAELRACATAGARAFVDAMPAAGGRDALRLAEASRRSGTHIIASTGLHVRRWYPGRSWANEASVADLADLFVADVEEGIDQYDYMGPLVRRTPHRAGLVKIGTDSVVPHDRDRRVFAAAAEAHHRSGVPLLTHCEEGHGGMEQVELLARLGVDPARVVLSHTDKVTDIAYHLDLVASGASLEFDQALRHPLDSGNPTVRLLARLAEAGCISQIVLGTDGARRSMWTAYGGSPGLAALLTGVVPLLRAAGVDEAAMRQVLVANPARSFALSGAAD